VEQASKLVLIVEDSPEIRGLVRTALESRGHRVIEADTEALGTSLFSQKRPDLVVLDVGLPDGSGVNICQKIRSHAELAATPVIMLTGESSLESKTAGFTAGADQYLIKPLRPEEFLLWVDALLKRHAYYAAQASVLKAGKLTIDLHARLVQYNETIVENLTAREFDLLYHLVKRRPQIISRDAILKQVWHTVAVDNLVDTHMSHLRRKLPTEVSDKIQSISGKGFRYFDGSEVNLKPKA
jgi:DNA-binding response OmpR family regulator